MCKNDPGSCVFFRLESVILVHGTIKFIQLETKNSSKTAYIEKEKTYFNSMLQVLMCLVDNV